MPELEPVTARPAAPLRRRQLELELPDGRRLALGSRTLVMGVLNVTPDSFSDGGRFLDPQAAAEQGLRLEALGADIVDIGAESTRPGAEPVPAAEEQRRLLPVLEALASRLRVPISVDTTKPEVARDALEAGAAILNDVSALRDGAGLAQVAAEKGAPLILMHSRGTPRTMAAETGYPDGVAEGVLEELSAAVERAITHGVPRESLLVDPGLGFAKTAEQSLELLARLRSLDGLELPLVVGASRKSFIGHVLDRPVERRREGTLAAEAAAILGGAHIVRTHDVEGCRQVADLLDAVRAAGEPAVIDALLDLLRLREFGLVDLAEILVVAFVFYRLLLLIRGTRAVQMVYGVIGLLFIYWITGPAILAYDTIHRLIMPLLFYIPFAIIVVFQNTLRRALTGFGANPFGRYLGASPIEDKLALVVSAAYALAARRIGGLIVLEREQGLRNWTESGITLDANISYDLIVNIFSPYTPLHDGALVIGDGRMKAASCFLPLTGNPALSTKYGTRHRAAIGITEETDAVCVVISEERGTVSLAIDGVIYDALEKGEVRARLERIIDPGRRGQNGPEGKVHGGRLAGGVFPAPAGERDDKLMARISGTAGGDREP